MGSWKIIEILLPRMWRSSSCGIFSRSCPWNRACPSIRAFLLRMRPIRVRKVTLLPEPDSPTTPSVSPGETVNETPSTALTRPSSVSKCTLRSLTSRSGSGTPLRPPALLKWRRPNRAWRSSVPHAWIQIGVHDVDEQVEEDHEERGDDRD